MFVSKRLTGAAVAAALLTTTACVTNPETGEQDFQTRTAVGALAGAVAGYFGGDLIGGRRDRTEKAVGAGVEAEADARAQPRLVHVSLVVEGGHGNGEDASEAGHRVPLR